MFTSKIAICGLPKVAGIVKATKYRNEAPSAPPSATLIVWIRVCSGTLLAFFFRGLYRKTTVNYENNNFLHYFSALLKRSFC